MSFLQMNNKIKITVLGYGHIGKRHVDVILNNSEFELVAVIESVSKESLFLAETGIPVFIDLSTFFDAKLKVDVIAVCTPNGLHFEHSKIIIEHGVNVIIEKPITLESIHAKILQDLSIKNSVEIFSVMQNRLSPPAIWLKSLLGSEKLGKIYMVQVSCYWNRDDQYYSHNKWHGTKKLDGGTLYTQFSHYLDVLLWMFGDITNIESKLENFNHQETTEFEDSGIITFDFQSGGIGSFSFSTAVWKENLESSLTIIAEKGSVKIGGQYMEKVEKCAVKDYVLPDLNKINLPSECESYKGSAQNHYLLYKDIANFINRNIMLSMELDESIKLIERIEDIYNN